MPKAKIFCWDEYDNFLWVSDAYGVVIGCVLWW